MNVIERFERTLFGGYTGTPEARRRFIRDDLIAHGYSVTIVDRVLREEDQRKAQRAESW